MKSTKAELKKVKREKEDLELKVNLLEYLKDPENLQKKKQTESQMAKNSGSIPRHTYRAEDIVTCLMLYVYCGSSYRSIPRILRVMCLRQGMEVGDLPDVTTVKGWVEKAGLAELQHSGKDLPESYAIVMDESISTGGFKLLLTLGIPSENVGHAVSHSDAVVLDMKVGAGFNSKDVKDTINEVAEDVGRVPQFMLSDGGKNLEKGASEAGLAHHHDVGHKFANILKKVYGEDPDFKDLAKQVGKTKHWTLDKDLAPLKAPNQRSIARYMNIFSWSAWLDKVLEAYHHLASKAKYHLGFVPRHASLAKELSEVGSMLKSVMEVLKSRGLSNDTAGECSKIMAKAQLTGGDQRMASIADMMTQYIKQELKLVEDGTGSHNISSDIIESSFGIYKNRRSSDKMAGITSIILAIALQTYASDENKWNDIDIRKLFANTTITDVRKWRKDSLPVSPNQLRKIKLSA